MNGWMDGICEARFEGGLLSHNCLGTYKIRPDCNQAE